MSVRKVRTTALQSIQSVYTVCRPCTLATMSVCSLLSSLSLNRQPRPACRPIIYTCIRHYSSQTPFLRCRQSLWQRANESGQHFVFCATLDLSTVQWPAIILRRETSRRASVLLHFLTSSPPQTTTDSTSRHRLISTVVVVVCGNQSSSSSPGIYSLRRRLSPSTPSDDTVKSTSLHRVETEQQTPSSRRSDVIYRTSLHRPVVGERQRRPVADRRRRRRHGPDALVVVRRYELPVSVSSSPRTSYINRRVVITDDLSVAKRDAAVIANATCLLVDP